MSDALDSVGRTHRIDEYWDWIAVVLFLLVTVDLVTTVFAAAAVGANAEANPVVRWAIGQGIVVLAGVNLLAVILVAVFFYGVVEMLRKTPRPYDRYFATALEVWIGLLVAAGLVVFANNLAVIVLDHSLLTALV